MSPVLHDGLLYTASDQGILTVVDAVTGKVVYEERLNHEGSTYPSLSVAGNRIYVSSDRGTTVVDSGYGAHAAQTVALLEHALAGEKLV